MQQNLKRKFNFYSQSFGFTLVELIIVVGMMTMFSGLMLPSFLNWIRIEKVAMNDFRR